MVDNSPFFDELMLLGFLLPELGNIIEDDYILKFMDELKDMG